MQIERKNQRPRRSSGSACRIMAAVVAPLFFAACQSPEAKKSDLIAANEPESIRPSEQRNQSSTSSGFSQRTIETRDEQYSQSNANNDQLPRPEIYPGTKRFMHEGVRSNSGYELDSSGRVSLNFVRTPLPDVVDAILGEALGLNYQIDPAVDGIVTARTSRPLNRASVLPVLENLLAANGAALLQADDVYRIVSYETTSRLPATVFTPDQREIAVGHGIHILPLSFAAASSLRDVLASQTNPGRQLLADPLRNLLIFVGPREEARTLEQMVDTLDVDILEGMSFALFPAEVADVDELISELEVVFAQKSEQGLKGIIRLLPIRRLNAVLAITPQPSYLSHVQTWVERLDRADSGAGRRIFVYYVKNGRAKDLAGTLNQVIGAAEQLVVNEGSQRFLAPGLEPIVIENLDRGESREPVYSEESGTAMGRRQFSETSDKGISLTSLGGDGSAARIIADERNNALVILSTATEFRVIERALSKLDILPLQVLIEATIAEVSLNDTLEYGLQWFFQSGNAQGTFSTSGTGAVAPTFPGFNILIDNANAQVVLNALAEVTDVNVISSPQLMVLDNQAARLQVGDQVPVATQSAVSVSDPDAPIVNSVELVDTGVILEVTPRVNASGLVSLDVLQEVSDAVETTTSDIDSPTIQQRRIESTVAVQSGDTVALGGLIRDRREDSESGLPVLKDIPILGNLFKSTEQASRRTELLVLITPRAVRDQSEAREVTEELRRRLSSLDPLEERIE